MTIEAKVIEDSVSSAGKRLTTLQLKYPRFIHAEFMTHRVFSRNASSSRAIPVAKMIEAVRTEPAMPIHWGKNQPGMQANEQLTGVELNDAKHCWLAAAQSAANVAEKMMAIGLHKQVANRVLEPFQHIHVIVTATEWDNFFALRAHPDAQPEIQALAVAIRDAMTHHQPRELADDEWHLPYIRDEERGLPIEQLVKMSAARCARVSYLKHDGVAPSLEDDLTLYERLVGSMPIHASPIEHQAAPDTLWSFDEGETEKWEWPELHGNFVGWKQYRKMVEHRINPEFNT